MKKLLITALAAAMVLSLCGCSFAEGFKGGILADNAEVSTGQDETAAPEKTEKPETEEIAKPSQMPEEESAAEENEFSHPIEAYFPDSWADRYVLEWDETSVKIYCKAAYGEETGSYGWLCSIVWVTDPNYIAPEYLELGVWEGSPVWMLMRSDVPVFSTEEIFAEWISMLQDTGTIADALREILQGGDTAAVDEELYVLPEQYVEFGYYTGVFELLCNDWTEESVNALLGAETPYGYISVAGDGTAYLMLGRELKQGTVVMYYDDTAKPEDSPLYRFTFDGVTYEADMLQTMLMVDGLPEYSAYGGEGTYTGTVWSFAHADNDWWTENTFSGDVG